MKDTTINIDEAIQTINNQNKRIEELCLEIERLNNIISKIEKAVEIAISEDNYDNGIYTIKGILGSDSNE